MKTKGLIMSAAALVTASMLSVPSAAVLTVVPDPEAALVVTSGREWKLSVSYEYNEVLTGVKRMDFLVEMEGDSEKFFREQESGFYEGQDNADGEPKAFVDINGFIAFSTGDWYQYGFEALKPTEGGTDTAGIISLGDGMYVFTADLSDKEIGINSGNNATVTMNEWGNSTEGVSFTVKGAYLYGENETPMFYYDEKGALTIDPEKPDYHSRLSSDSDETAGEEAASETQTEETKAEETTAEETKAEETKAEETTAEANDNSSETTAANQTAQAPANAAASQSADLQSRDASLMIVLIVAGVLIVGVAAVLIIMMLKKKNQ